jgi:hypothetical protein
MSKHSREVGWRWMPRLSDHGEVGTTVHACFYADRGHEEADIRWTKTTVNVSGTNVLITINRDCAHGLVAGTGEKKEEPECFAK